MVSMKDGVGIQNRIMSDELDGAVLVTEVRRDYSSHLLGNGWHNNNKISLLLLVT